jgi:hypothetical protein
MIGKDEGLRLQNAVFIYPTDQEWALSVRRQWQCRANLGAQERAELENDIAQLKMALRNDLRTGKRRMGGIKAGEHEMCFPDNVWCTTAALDLGQNTATAHELTLRDVRIFFPEATPRPAATAVEKEASSSPPTMPITTEVVSGRRKPRGINYAADDAPLVQEMHHLIVAGKARNPWDAALAVADRAVGTKDIQSRAKRLLGRYSAASSSERD